MRPPAARPPTVGAEASQAGRPGSARPPAGPSTSRPTVGVANERATSRAIGRSVSGKTAFQPRPASKPGTVIASGITRCRRSTQAAAARNRNRIAWARYRRPSVAEYVVAMPTGSWLPRTTSHHQRATAARIVIPQTVWCRRASAGRNSTIAATPRVRSQPAPAASGTTTRSIIGLAIQAVGFSPGRVMGSAPGSCRKDRRWPVPRQPARR